MQDTFYRNNKMTIMLEDSLKGCDTFEEFEKYFSDELLCEDCWIGFTKRFGIEPVFRRRNDRKTKERAEKYFLFL